MGVGTVADRVVLDLPLRLHSEMNERGHFMRRYQRTRQQKDAVLCEWLRQHRPIVQPPVVVTITRIGQRKLDTDNLAGSAKAVQDAVAEHVLQTDDGSELIEWRYAQEKGKPKEYRCRVEVVACD